MTDKITFSDYFSAEQALEHFNHWVKSPSGRSNPASEEEKAWSARYSELSDVLEASVTRYLVALRDRGDLGFIPHAEGRGHRWAAPWNRFLQGQEEHWDVSRIVSPIHHWLEMEIAAHRRAPGDPADLPAKSYATVVEAMNKGAFEWWQMGTDAACECNATGKRLQAVIKTGWQPVLGEVKHDRTPSRKESEFVALTEDPPVAEVITHRIPVPSGELIVADWFRLESNLFTEIVKEGQPEDSINYGFGCAALTAHYARNFGFMSVQVGNSSPGIVVRDDHIVMGRLDEDSRVDEECDDSPRLLKGEVVGRVCTDLWWTTAIDRQVLCDVLAKRVGAEEAKRIVDEYVESAEPSGNLVVLKVKQGELYFHSTANRDDLAQFRCEEPAQVDFNAVEPFLVISERPLVWAKVEALDDQPKAASRRPRP